MPLSTPAFSMPAFSRRLPGARILTVLPNNGTSAYTTGKTIGTVQTVSLANLGGGTNSTVKGVRIVRALVADTNEVGCDMDLHFWDTSIVGQADVATFAHASVAEAATYCGKIAVATAIDISGLGKYTNALLTDAQSIMIALQSQQFYMQAVAKASKTFTNPSVITVQLEVELLY